MQSIFKTALLATLLFCMNMQIGHTEDMSKSDDYMPSLITKTPLEGRMLAIKIVRKTIGTIQRDGKIKHAVRKEYQDDAELLMRAAELVTMEFKTIAIANNYWR